MTPFPGFETRRLRVSGVTIHAQDMWDSGVISHLNEAARALGLAVGQPQQAALRQVARG